MGGGMDIRFLGLLRPVFILALLSVGVEAKSTKLFGSEIGRQH
jgi:hypothetical protein